MMIRQRWCNTVMIRLNQQYREPIGKSTQQLLVNKSITTFLLIERSVPSSIGVYTFSPSNLDETHLGKPSTATYSYKYTFRGRLAYGDGQCYNWNPHTMISLRKKHWYWDQPSHEWSALMQTSPYLTIQLQLRWEALSWLKQTWRVDSLHRVKCIHGHNQSNSAAQPQWPRCLRWALRAPFSWKMTVRLLYPR